MSRLLRVGSAPRDEAELGGGGGGLRRACGGGGGDDLGRLDAAFSSTLGSRSAAPPRVGGMKGRVSRLARRRRGTLSYQHLSHLILEFLSGANMGRRAAR